MRVKILDKELYADELAQGLLTSKWPGDAGVDLRSRIDVKVHQGETVKIPLGIAVAIPVGFMGWIGGRSSTAVNESLLTHEGKIDSGYRGEIHSICTAIGSPVNIERGQRIAQLVLVAVATPVDPISYRFGWEFVEELDEGDGRGEGSFGSTGSR